MHLQRISSCFLLIGLLVILQISDSNLCRKESLLKSLLGNRKLLNASDKIVQNLLLNLAGFQNAKSNDFRILDTKSNDPKTTIIRFGRIIRKSLEKDVEVFNKLVEPKLKLRKSKIGNFQPKDLLQTSIHQQALILSDFGFYAKQLWPRFKKIIWSEKLRKRLIPKCRNTEDFYTFDLLDSLTTFSKRVLECLSSDSEKSKFLERVTIFLANSPAKFQRIFRKFSKEFLRDPNKKNKRCNNSLPNYFCRLVIEKPKDFRSCLVEFKRLEKCIYDKQKKSENSSKKTSKTLSLRNDIRILTDNQPTRGKLLVLENSTSIPEKIQRILEAITNQKFSRNSELGKICRNLADQILGNGNSVTNRILSEISLVSEIYANGMKKERLLRSFSRCNETSRAKYRNLAKSLVNYRNYFIFKFQEFWMDVYDSVKSFQSLLVDKIKYVFQNTLELHYKVFYELYKWFSNVGVIFNVENKDQGEIGPTTTELIVIDTSMQDDGPVDDKSIGFEEKEDDDAGNFEEEEEEEEEDGNDDFNVFFGDEKKFLQQNSHLTPTELRKGKVLRRSMMRALRSMNQLTIKNSSGGSNSVLGLIANKLLLVGLFYETLAFVSYHFPGTSGCGCSGNNNNQGNFNTDYPNKQQWESGYKK